MYFVKGNLTEFSGKCCLSRSQHWVSALAPGMANVWIMFQQGVSASAVPQHCREDAIPSSEVSKAYSYSSVGWGERKKVWERQNWAGRREDQVHEKGWAINSVCHYILNCPPLHKLGHLTHASLTLYPLKLRCKRGGPVLLAVICPEEAYPAGSSSVHRFLQFPFWSHWSTVCC